LGNVPDVDDTEGSMDRDELLKREEEAWLDFADTFTAVPPDRRDVEGVVPGWSTHDLVWHCAYWAGYAGDGLERIHAGENARRPRGDPEPADTWLSEAEVLSRGRTMSWDQVIQQADQERKRVRAALSALRELPELAREWFRDDTFEHYDEHRAEIHAFGA
jgi:hypothetical protein